MSRLRVALAAYWIEHSNMFPNRDPLKCLNAKLWSGSSASLIHVQEPVL